MVPLQPGPPRNFGAVRAIGWLAVGAATLCLALTVISTSYTPATRIGDAISLDSVWTSGRAFDAPNLDTGDTTLPDKELLLPPKMSPALDSYFKQMTGIPVSDKEGEDRSNACFENEEAHGDLCYRKCSLLTNGRFNLRTSPWTCCNADRSNECFVRNQDLNLGSRFGLCSGYDVGGDGDSCPHAVGKCLENEELFMGACYESCAIATKGTHPYRTSAISSCETKLSLSFSSFTPNKVMVGKTLAEGGGKGDGDKSTPAHSHPPIRPGDQEPDVPVTH